MRQRRPSAGLLLAPLLAVAAAGCDFHGDPLVILPEFDDVTSFETGLEKWTPRARDLGTPPAAWEIARSADLATQGTQGARYRLTNGAGEAKIFLERRYEAEKDQRYFVEISFDMASADTIGPALWRVVAGAAPDSPLTTGVVSTPGDTSNGRTSGAGFVWLPRTFSTEMTTDADGELFVYVGVWATSPGARTYHVDNLEVTLTRRGITTAK